MPPEDALPRPNSCCARLNSLDREAFIEALGWVFEHSPWVAERAWASRPFAGIDALHAAMTAQVDAASPEEQLALLGAHPDLGSRARMMPASAAEQTGAGLDRLTPAEFERLQSMNARYREKFGFPFLLAVKGCSKYDILQELERRLGASAWEEFKEAIRQVNRIARFRLQDVLMDGSD